MSTLRWVPAAGERPMTRREGLVVAALSAWAVAGLALDGRAHQEDAVESFFTVWHAILYTGIGAAGVWVATQLRAARRHGTVPSGFALTVAGLALLAAGGPADLAWHEAFGLEADVAALLSPTHLLLMAGGVLLLSAPLRAAWTAADTRRAPVAALLSLTLVAGVVAFFFQYASPFHEVEAFGSRAHGEQELGLAAVALSNLILVSPLVLLVRRFGTPPPGAATLLFAGVAGVVAVSGDFEAPAAFAGAVVAGIAVDGLAALLRPAPERPAAFRAFAALAPAVLWAAVFGALALDGALAWATELWSGSILLAAAAGYGLALLASLPGRAAPLAA